MRKVSPAAIVVVIELIALVVGLIVHGPLLDLRIYRLGAAAAYSGLDQLYQAQDQASGLYFTYPPIAALILGPTRWIPDTLGTFLLTAISIGALARVAVLISRHLPGDRWWQRPLPILALGIACEPTISTVMYGQVNIILLALVVEDLLGPRRRYSGIFIGLAAAIKLVPALFILLLIVGKRFGAAVISVATLIVSMLIGLLFLPQSTMTYWSGTAFDVHRVGGVSYISNQSVNGLLWRLFHHGENRLFWLALVAVTTLICLAWAWISIQRRDWLWASSATGLAALLASPISWSHHWVWIIPLVAALLGSAQAHNGWRRRVLMTLAVSWMIAICGWLIYLVPRGNNAEFEAGVIQIIIGNSYAWLGLLTVGLLAVWSIRQMRSRAPFPAVSP